MFHYIRFLSLCVVITQVSGACVAMNNLLCVVLCLFRQKQKIRKRIYLLGDASVK